MGQFLATIHCDLENYFTGCTQVERFISAGWHSATSWNMNEVYGLLPRSEVEMLVPQYKDNHCCKVARVEAIERLDEKELLR